MAYKDIINNICNTIHTGLIDFNEPRSEASMPTQASSEFITNKQQGDWAEDVLFRAINDNSENIVAVRYGKSDDLVAGDAGFEKFFNEYQAELDTIGKRPDLFLKRRISVAHQKPLLQSTPLFSVRLIPSKEPCPQSLSMII